MTLSIYLTVQQVIMGCIIALCAQLIFIHIPTELRGSRMVLSGRIMGAAVMMIPLASFIYYFSDLRYAEAQYATAINLSAYSLTTTLVSTAYYVLLDLVRYKAMMKIHLAIGLLYPIPMWIGLYFGGALVDKHVLIIAYTLFCMLATFEIVTCIYFYILKKRNFDMCESEIEEIEFKLLDRTIYVACILIVVSMLSPSFSSYPLWLGAIFLTIFVSGDIYIYVCYHKILSGGINTLIKARQIPIDPIVDEQIDLFGGDLFAVNDVVKSNIEKNLRVWITQKEFLKPNASIGNVAKAVYTNRTYLSKYVNSTYRCSFKSWITHLRIEESKALMQNNPELSLSDIAKLTGFASVESFSHTFARKEQTSPSRWRESTRN